MQPRTHCELLKVVATEAEKLLIDWTPPPTCPLFLAKNAQCVLSSSEQCRTLQVDLKTYTHGSAGCESPISGYQLNGVPIFTETSSGIHKAPFCIHHIVELEV